MISMASNSAIHVGSQTKIHLKTALEEREAFGRDSTDDKLRAQACVCVRVCVCACACAYVCVVCVCVCVYMYIYIHMYMYMYMYVYMYVYIYIHTYITSTDTRGSASMSATRLQTLPAAGIREQEGQDRLSRRNCRPHAGWFFYYTHFTTHILVHTDFPVEIAVPMQVVGFYDTHCTTHFSTHRLSRQIAVPCRLVFFYCA
jgi:hypothetical protein